MSTVCAGKIMSGGSCTGVFCPILSCQSSFRMVSNGETLIFEVHPQRLFNTYVSVHVRVAVKTPRFFRANLCRIMFIYIIPFFTVLFCSSVDRYELRPDRTLTYTKVYACGRKTGVLTNVTGARCVNQCGDYRGWKRKVRFTRGSSRMMIDF